MLIMQLGRCILPKTSSPFVGCPFHEGEAEEEGEMERQEEEEKGGRAGGGHIERRDPRWRRCQRTEAGEGESRREEGSYMPVRWANRAANRPCRKVSLDDCTRRALVKRHGTQVSPATA